VTPAILLLQKQGIQFETLSYDHDPDNQHYGDEAVSALGLSAQEVFKTLVIQSGEAAGQFAVALLPVAASLNLKRAAKALGWKKLSLADPADAQRVSGYQLGGVSPLGQKKLLPTLIDSSVLNLGQVYVSAGKRGLELALQPEVLKQLLKAQCVPIADLRTEPTRL